MENAEEAMSGYLLSLFEHEEHIPERSDIESVVIKEKGAFVAMVKSDILKKDYSKSVKKTLTKPAWLNERANRQGVNFSQLLQEALLSKIQR